jgi:hypothetical protein
MQQRLKYLSTEYVEEPGDVMLTKTYNITCLRCHNIMIAQIKIIP